MADLKGRVIAHRGASAHAPENTLAAFRAAKALGADWVELDVSLSADGVPVIIHDETLDRTTNLSGPVHLRTAAELGRADAGSWFDARFAGEGVPTLAEALALFGEIGLGVNVELKPATNPKEVINLCRAVDRVLRLRPASVPVVVSSFMPELLAEMARIGNVEPRAMLWEAVPAAWINVLKSLPVEALHLDVHALVPGLITAAQAAGIAVRVWTCNQPDMLAPYWREGLAAVITDDPALYGEGRSLS